MIATRPASMPLHITDGSGLPKRKYIPSAAKHAPAAEASIVFSATAAIWASVPASVEPGLNPNQPKARIKVPRNT